jgi:hypothetical protein
MQPTLLPLEWMQRWRVPWAKASHCWVHEQQTCLHSKLRWYYHRPHRHRWEYIRKERGWIPSWWRGIVPRRWAIHCRSWLIRCSWEQSSFLIYIYLLLPFDISNIVLLIISDAMKCNYLMLFHFWMRKNKL